ncbi:MAG: Bifunctional adenosylcobalamin biosynthesis protein CobP [Syntrophus sp. SKADARSKE-3]|nr:Bifunctional adenosylcobalamin biosynthesis protein CobP [Syntrophus sp. SKADARSKE-3]
MASIVFITGGGRSGKSAFAQGLAEAIPEARVYLATAPVLDKEMARRIARHQADRKAGGWKTVEETLDIAGVMMKIPDGATVLVDCLTLWINNLMYTAERQGADVTEDYIADVCLNVIAACKRREGTVIFVTNEVGMGIIPDNSSSRLFRDLAGRCNQIMAAAADKVIFMVSGLPLHLKGP